MRKPGAAAATAVVLAGTVLGLVVLPGTVPAGAQEAVPPGPAPGLSSEVAALPASSPDLDAATAKLDAAQRRLADDRADLDRTSTDLDSMQAERTGVTGIAARRSAQLAKARADLAVIRDDLRRLVAAWYVQGAGDLPSLDPALTAAQAQELRVQQVMAEAAASGSIDAEHRLAARIDVLADQEDRMARRRDELDRRTTDLTRRRDRLTATIAQDGAALLADAGAAAQARLDATIDGTDVSTIAMDAYWRAAGDLRLLSPGCGLTWWMLAGIGATESRHGTYLGAHVAPDGRVDPPITGPALDGSNGFAVVADSDGGRLDGIATSDRAVGPMQFLPSTWRVVGRDGNGDGVADPQNMYDAALAAGVYLCRSGPVSDDGGLRRAYWSYNQSAPYVDVVMQRAASYRDSVALPSAP